jgi:hypothetical protein
MLTPLKALVNEFYQSNYKPREEMEKVRDKEIVVDAQLFDEVLKLPLLKFEIDGFKINSTTPQTYFKTCLKVGKGK